MATIGIDLGTTYSAIATSEDGLSARILPNTMGENTTPSVVFFSEGDKRDDETLVGSVAKDMAGSDSGATVQFVKREMGNPDYLYYSPSGRRYHAEEISAIILKYLKGSAEEALGEPVSDAVITVPAYFDDAKRTATKQAGAIAGLNVLQVFNEPTAAALAYGVESDSDGKVLVFDLGGGTFDVTLMDVHDNCFDVIATDGDSHLGGIDFDRRIVELVIEGLREQGLEVDEDDPDFMDEINAQAESMKMALSNMRQVVKPFTIDGKTAKVRITREQFERASVDLLSRTEELLEPLLANQHLTWANIDQLLMVGGSTRMPMVKEMLERVSGKKLKYEVSPDEAVALGAAIYAKNLQRVQRSQGTRRMDGGRGLPTDADEPDAVYEIPESGMAISISDVTSQSLGVIAIDNEQGGRERNFVIIPHNTKIPAKMSQTFYTVADNQSSVQIQVTEGDDSEIDYVNIIGKKTLPLPPHPKESPMQIIYNYDIDQTVFVEAIDGLTGQSLGTFDIDRSSNLTDAQVNEMAAHVRRMNSLDS